MLITILPLVYLYDWFIFIHVKFSIIQFFSRMNTYLNGAYLSVKILYTGFLHMTIYRARISWVGHAGDKMRECVCVQNAVTIETLITYIHTHMHTNIHTCTYCLSTSKQLVLATPHSSYNGRMTCKTNECVTCDTATQNILDTPFSNSSWSRGLDLFSSPTRS